MWNSQGNNRLGTVYFATLRISTEYSCILSYADVLELLGHATQATWYRHTVYTAAITVYLGLKSIYFNLVPISILTMMICSIIYDRLSALIFPIAQWLERVPFTW